MPSLCDTQAGFRAAIAGGNASALLQTLRAPADPEERLEIYRRHYRESFRRHLRGRYPTLEWLLGTARLVELADLTLQLSPPRAPSLAEYGAELIDAVAASAVDLPPYIVDVARLDWHLGCLSVALAHAPVALVTLAAVDPLRLPELQFTLQPGLAFVSSAWPVDELVHLRHQDSQPNELVFASRATHLQLRGARGQFTLLRLEPGTFTFRASLAAGDPLGEAAAQAAAAQPGFDLSAALATLFSEGLVINHSLETFHV